eukprot:2526780-Amphidinium_carterae.1
MQRKPPTQHHYGTVCVTTVTSLTRIPERETAHLASMASTCGRMAWNTSARLRALEPTTATTLFGHCQALWLIIFKTLAASVLEMSVCYRLACGRLTWFLCLRGCSRSCSHSVELAHASPNQKFQFCFGQTKTAAYLFLGVTHDDATCSFGQIFIVWNRFFGEYAAVFNRYAKGGFGELEVGEILLYLMRSNRLLARETPLAFLVPLARYVDSWVLC